MAQVTAPNILCKQEGELITYAMEFANLLATGESLSSVTDVTASPTGLTIGSASISGTEVRFAISAGVHHKKYRVQVEVITSTGNTRIGDGLLQVTDK